MNPNTSTEEGSGAPGRFDLDFALPRPDGKKAKRRPSRKETAKSALTHWGVAKSLKTGPWLSEACAFGDPAEETTQNAYAIRDSWRFRIMQPPKIVAEPARKDRACKIQHQDAQEQNALALALKLARRWANCDAMLCRAAEQDDAAAVFCRLVLYKVRQGKFAVTEPALRRLWTNSFIDSYRRDLLQEARRDAGLLLEGDQETKEKSPGCEAFSGEINLHQRAEREAAAHQQARFKLNELSAADRRLYSAILGWDDLQGKMTNKRLGEQLNVSETAVRKQRKRLQQTLSEVHA